MEDKGARTRGERGEGEIEIDRVGGREGEGCSSTQTKREMKEMTKGSGFANRGIVYR